jgi:uncharacterized protein (TIGR02996 family)
VTTSSGSPTAQTSRSLLDAIRARPDDDEARLVYADALSTAGDPRGEFIAVQQALARGDDSLALARRDNELLCEHGAAFATPHERTTYMFHRGFVEHLTIPIDVFFEHGPEILPREPITHLTLLFPTSYDDVRDSQVLAETNAPMLLRALDVPEHFTTEDFENLARSPHLTRLRSLTFPRHVGDDRAFAALANASLPALANLELVAYDDAKYTSTGVTALAESQALGALRGLSLHSRGDCTHRDGLAALAASALYTRLERFSLRADRIGNEVIGALVLGAHGPTSLQLGELDADDITALVTSQRASQWTALDFRTYSAIPAAFFEAPFPALREVAIHIGPDVPKQVPRCAWLDELTTLALTSIDEIDLDVLLARQSLGALRHLTIEITDRGLEALAAHPLPQLESLVLRDDHFHAFTPKGFAALARAPWLPRLRSLHLDRITDEHVAALEHGRFDALRVLGFRKVLTHGRGRRSPSDFNRILRRLAAIPFPRLREFHGHAPQRDGRWLVDLPAFDGVLVYPERAGHARTRSLARRC